jgi:hypothetical protein
MQNKSQYFSYVITKYPKIQKKNVNTRLCRQALVTPILSDMWSKMYETLTAAHFDSNLLHISLQ